MATWHREHICIDVPWSRLGPTVGGAIRLLADVITAGFLGILSWVMILRAWKTIASGVATSELRLPLWPVNLVIAAGIVVAVIYAVILIIPRKESSQ